MGGGSSVAARQDSIPKAAHEPAAGDGIKSIRTTSVFKAVNFELYVKPNIVVMGFGTVAILCSAIYLAYMKSQLKESKTYVAIGEDDSKVLLLKKSKWD
ncbi:Small integral membrane protein 8 [Portunus trituberculatus]|uniref:Small integral membrane protein 8 n=1 Tax=Portunus trituberculatus TaxID=210409 RepID=A0A5B7CXF2_PORTR|nr:Small integral membrane protein 8 [Portunus trituberculatus]